MVHKKKMKVNLKTQTHCNSINPDKSKIESQQYKRIRNKQRFIKTIRNKTKLTTLYYPHDHANIDSPLPQ